MSYHDILKEKVWGYFMIIPVVLVSILFLFGMWYIVTSSSDRYECGEKIVSIDDCGDLSPASDSIFKLATESQLNQIINLLGTIAACLKFFVFVIVCWIIAKIALFVMYGTAALKVIDGINQFL